MMRRSRCSFSLRAAIAVVGLAMLVGGCDSGIADDSDSPKAVSAPAADVSATANQARESWLRGIDSMISSLDSLEKLVGMVDASEASISRAQRAFASTRAAFKRIEFIATYYEPTTTAKINGPVLPHPEEDEGPDVVFPPEGLQVIEEWLYSGADIARLPAITTEVGNVRALTRNLQRASESQQVTDNRIWEAASLEIARVATLGIVGFDSPIAQLSLKESAAALEGIHAALGAYRMQLDAATWKSLDDRFASAIRALSVDSSFADFNRLKFIVAEANPLARAVFEANKKLGLVAPPDRRAFRADVASIFDSAAFDAQAFANPTSDRDSPMQAALGEKLFFEARLSGDQKQSCSSCHEPGRAFTDGRARSVSRLTEHAATMRNTPTVINAGLQNGLFADQRTAFLEDQVEAVLASKKEMHSNTEDAVKRLSADSEYTHAFATAFGAKSDSSITALRVRKAIAAYVRSLTALNSNVDRAMRGDTLALSSNERAGFNLFAGKAKCASCHFLPLFNGSVPPTYRSSDVEVLGVPARVTTKNGRIDPDSGRFAITRTAPHLFAFKTPGIRNVAITAPYMHNGAYRTLEEVVDFYARGGGVGIGIQLGNQTLPFDSLQLSKAEQADVVQFLKALTDTSSFRRPVARRP